MREGEISKHQITDFFLNGLEKGANFNLCQSFTLVMSSVRWPGAILWLNMPEMPEMPTSEPLLLRLTSVSSRRAAHLFLY